MVVLMHRVEKELELRSIVPHDPVRLAMRQRGTVACRILRKVVDALAADEESGPLSRVGPREEIDAGDFQATAPPKNAWMASPRRIQEASGEDTRAQVYPHTSSRLHAI